MRFIFTSVIGGLLALPVQARVLTCQFDTQRFKPPVPATLMLAVDKAQGTVKIDDPQFRPCSSAPMVGKIETSNAVRETFVWRSPTRKLPDVEDPKAVLYRVTFFESDGKAVIHHQYAYFPYGQAEGTCTWGK